jgi:hypothetical protein
MIESINNAREELKRVDHLIFVSLKYTRTVDVLKNVIERMINTIEFGVEALLIYLKEQKKIHALPSSHKEKIDDVLKYFPDDQKVIDFMNFYQELRKIRRAQYAKREEFRKHVTMIATLDDGKVVEFDIEKAMQYNENIISFIDYIEERIGLKKGEDDD